MNSKNCKKKIKDKKIKNEKIRKKLQDKIKKKQEVEIHKKKKMQIKKNRLSHKIPKMEKRLHLEKKNHENQAKKLCRRMKKNT
jgi:hypothetical protein